MGGGVEGFRRKVISRRRRRTEPEGRKEGRGCQDTKGVGRSEEEEEKEGKKEEEKEEEEKEDKGGRQGRGGRRERRPLAALDGFRLGFQQSYIYV